MNIRRGTRWLAPLLISTLLPAGVCAATLAEVKTVYLFPMSNGFDQYLADCLTRNHVFQVVTDPKAADAVITDQLGLAFETELLNARPELKPVPPKKETADKDKDKDKDDKDKDKDKDDADKKDDKADEMPHINSFHLSHGTVFIVQARTQQVVWSTYQRPANHTPKELERTAVKVARLLEKDMAPPAAGGTAGK